MVAKRGYFSISLLFTIVSAIVSTFSFAPTLYGAPQQPGAVPIIVTDQLSTSLSDKHYNPAIQGLKENGDVFIGDVSALFRWNYGSATLTRLLQEKDPIPDFPGSFAFSLGVGSMQLNAAGHAAIINSWAAKGVRDPAGIFVYDGSTYSKIALTGEAVPGVSGSVFSNFNSVAINQSDQVAFVAEYEPVGEYIRGVFLGSPGNPTQKIATLQDIDVLTGTGYENILLIGIDTSGNAAFLCYETYNPSGYAVFIGSPSGLLQVVASGNAAPGSTSGQFNLTSNAGNYFLNAGGDLAFYANVYGDATVTQGIWIRRSWGPIEKVVVNGDPTGTSLGGAFGMGSIRGFNSAGKVLFSSNLSGATSPYGLFLRNTADPAQVVCYRNQTVPSRSELFNNVTLARLNDSGNVAFYASLTGGSSPAGWFLGSGTTAPATIVLQGDATPIGGTYGLMNFSNPRLNSSGQLVFGADILGPNANGLFIWTNGSGVQGIVSTDDNLPSGARPALRFAAQSASDDEVIFFARKTGGKDTIFTKSLQPGDDTIRRIVGDGDAAPGGGLITTIVRPAINDGEEIVFSSTIVGGSIYPASVLWISQPGAGLQDLAMTGDAAPGTAGGTLSGFPSQARINNAGEVAFYANISGASGGSNAGIFVASLAGGVQKVVRLGEASPAGGTFTSINAVPWFNNAGQVLFRASSQSGSIITDGLFIGSATSSPVKLVATGDTIDSSNVNQIRGFSSINNAGQVAVNLDLGSSPNGIFLMAAGSAPVLLVY